MVEFSTQKNVLSWICTIKRLHATITVVGLPLTLRLDIHTNEKKNKKKKKAAIVHTVFEKLERANVFHCFLIIDVKLLWIVQS